MVFLFYLYLVRFNDATNEVFKKMEKFIKDFHVLNRKKSKGKSSKDSLEDKEYKEYLVTLQEQETLTIENS